jgi:hypothetical protein
MTRPLFQEKRATLFSRPGHWLVESRWKIIYNILCLVEEKIPLMVFSALQTGERLVFLREKISGALKRAQPFRGRRPIEE